MQRMLSGKDPNRPSSSGGGGGRNSRASNLSAVSRATGQAPGESGGPVADKQDVALPAGVMSMLRAGTEGSMSDIGGNLSRASQRKNAGSRMSTTSNTSAYSAQTNQQSQQRASSSAAVRNVPPMHTGPQHAADTLSPTSMFPSSSPGVPYQQHHDVDSQRSSSITHSMPQQPVSQASNSRSTGNLRGPESSQHGQMPYGPPPPGRHLQNTQRAASPSWARRPGTDPRRLQTPINSGYGYSSSHYPPGQHQSGQYPLGHYPPAQYNNCPYSSGQYNHGPYSSGQYNHGPYSSGQYNPGPYSSGHGRSRRPSDASTGYSDGGYNAPHQTHRGPSHGYCSRPGERDVPPLPQMDSRYQKYVRSPAPNMYPPVDHHGINRSVQGSTSSGSTNVRTDSDNPSSDFGPPTTPRDGMSINSTIYPPGIPMTTGMMGPTGGYRRPNSPPYYDGSEQFETEEYYKPEPEPMSTRRGVHSKMRAVTPDYNIPLAKARPLTSFKTSVETESFVPAGIAELPASPVGRRITRDLVHQGMGPPSTTGDLASSTSPRTVAVDTGTTHYSQVDVTIRRMGEESSDPIMPRTDHGETQHSNASQTDAGLIESSTIDFAVRYSIPAMTGDGPLKDEATDPATASTATGSSEKHTDSGISELLAGYQHTDTKGEDKSIPAVEQGRKQGALVNSDLERVGNHAQQSSGEQSFKSCTDVLESAASESVGIAANVGEAAKTMSPESQLPVKDIDARSFQTCNDMETPGRTNTMPPSRLPSSNLDVESQHTKPTAGLSSPFQGLRRAFGVRQESAFSFSSKLMGKKPAANHGSVSLSGSSSTLSNSQSPAVPLRESSASKEAQRHKAVGSYLMRKAHLPFGRGKKLVSDDGGLAVKSSMETSVDHDEQRDESSSLTEASPLPQKHSDIDTAEEMPVKQNTRPEMKIPRKPVGGHSTSGDLRVGLTILPPLHHHSLSSPMLDIPQPSSMYSLQDLALKCRTYSSPAGVSMEPEHNQRDSQSTTHLSWGGRKPFGVPSASASEPHMALSSVREDTTTDLRLSMWRYQPPQRYLHDLKEDSHEDSSLNTSASNLKNSQFRFPHSVGLDVHNSADDTGVLGRKSYMGSRRASSIIEDFRGLPFLEISEANLYERFKSALPEDVRFSKASARAFLDVPDVVEMSPVLKEQKQVDHAVKGADGNKKLRHSVHSLHIIDVSVLRRRYSSEKLIAEIDRVSIPSITQLTQRVGEMFPSLSLVGSREREASDEGVVEFPEEQEIMEHAMEEIHHVHPPTQKRSSARLRPVRGSSALMVVEDDVYEEIASKEGGRERRGGQSGGSLSHQVDVGEAGSRATGKGKTTTRTPTRQLSTVVELQTPFSNTLSPEDCTTPDPGHRTSAESALSSLAGSPKSFVSTPTATETRPWNSDKNYPWATTTNPSIDISLPPQASLKQSPRPGPSHLRNALSDATSSTFTSLRTPVTPPYSKISGSSTNRQSYRLSTFGRSGDQAHAVGERYPTSALSPPTAIFRDHLSTCDTSDDEDFTTTRKSNKLTLRKRFSSAARSNTLTHTTSRVVRSKTNPTELVSPASGHENSSSTLQDRIGEARAFTSNRHTFRDAQGMPIGAYHRHRIVDSIKRWWHKSGELIRTISRRGNNRKDVDDDGGN